MTIDKSQAIAIAQMLNDHKQSFDLRVEMFNAIARETKAKFDALLDAGFSESQALNLLKGSV